MRVFDSVELKINPAAEVDRYQVVSLPRDGTTVCGVVAHGHEDKTGIDYLEVLLGAGQMRMDLQRVYPTQVIGIRGIPDLRRLRGRVVASLSRLRPEWVIQDNGLYILPEGASFDPCREKTVGEGQLYSISWVARDQQSLRDRPTPRLGDAFAAR